MAQRQNKSRTLCQFSGSPSLKTEEITTTKREKKVSTTLQQEMSTTDKLIRRKGARTLRQ